jgi:hypothetical protein
MKKVDLLKQHEEWLKKMGVKVGKPVRRSPYNIPDLRVGLRNTVPTSDTVGNGYAKKANAYSGSDNLIVGQAYNKGNYVVLSKAEAADPATGKRR